MISGTRGLGFVLALCAAEIFGLFGFATFQTLIPTFQTEWALSNSQSGWIAGVYFAGYVAAVPVLTSLTDRIAPRHVLVCSLVLSALSALAFAYWAEGFLSAMAFRLLQGIGLAGTYMPGLKALTDAVGGDKQSRYVSFYTASFGIGVAASYLLTGFAESLAGWEAAFIASAIGAAIGIVVVFFVLPSDAPPAIDRHLLDVRPVLRNRSSMGYILAYCGHNWELFAFRSWVVAFLVFAMVRHPGSAFAVEPTVVAAALTLLGMPSSIFGNELAMKIGRGRAITMIAALSVGLSLVIGIAAGTSYALVVALCLFYGLLLAGDSGAITAGAVASAGAGARGITLAMHSFIGFMGGIFGPAVAGIVLDAAGTDSVFGWALALASMGLGSVAVILAIRLGRVRD